MVVLLGGLALWRPRSAPGSLWAAEEEPQRHWRGQIAQFRCQTRGGQPLVRGSPTGEQCGRQFGRPENGGPMVARNYAAAEQAEAKLQCVCVCNLHATSYMQVLSMGGFQHGQLAGGETY